MKTISNYIKNHFLPFLNWKQKINKKTLTSDLLAWITWAIIVLPQWIAFATIAWLPPEYGLYTAMVTPIIAWLFGSSMHLISGPTTAISLVIFATVSTYAKPLSSEFIQITLTLTLLAWIYQFIFWLFKLWRLVDFVSHTVVIWFTAWAALLIVTSQAKNILWVSLEHSWLFFETWIEILKKIGTTNFYALLIWVSTFLLAFLLKKFYPKLPNLLISLVFGSVLAYFLHLDKNIIKYVPEIVWKLPPFSMPTFSLGTIKNLAPSAFSIALLWLIEAISISRSIASKSWQRIDANQEFIWQWLSNIVWSFFSSYAWSGSFTRSWVNYSSWATTPLSWIFAAIFLAMIILLVAPITRFIPISAMAWVIILVWLNLINFSQIKKVLYSNKNEATILLVTFFSTLFFELEFAIYFGVLLSIILYLNKTSHPEITKLVSNFDSSRNKKILLETSKILPEKVKLLYCPQIQILNIDMWIYFGSINYIQDLLIDTFEKNE